MHLQAYAQGLAVASMAWSKSGDMIAIALRMRELCLFMLYILQNRLTQWQFSTRPQLLYQCQRGLTRAVVSNLGFSDDNRWVFMSTERGTSHIFAINRPKISPMASGANENKKDNGVKICCKSSFSFFPDTL